MRRLLFTVLLLCVLAARGEEHPVPLDAAWTLPDGARLTPAGTLEIQIRPGKEANRFLTAQRTFDIIPYRGHDIELVYRLEDAGYGVHDHMFELLTTVLNSIMSLIQVPPNEANSQEEEEEKEEKEEEKEEKGEKGEKEEKEEKQEKEEEKEESPDMTATLLAFASKLESLGGASIEALSPDLLTISAQLFRDDEILTSGSGGNIPSGLVIGTITSIQTEAAGQTEYGIITPSADLDSLVQVFIITDFGGTAQTQPETGTEQPEQSEAPAESAAPSSPAATGG